MSRILLTLPRLTGHRSADILLVFQRFRPRWQKRRCATICATSGVRMWTATGSGKSAFHPINTGLKCILMEVGESGQKGRKQIFKSCASAISPHRLESTRDFRRRLGAAQGTVQLSQLLRRKCTAPNPNSISALVLASATLLDKAACPGGRRNLVLRWNYLTQDAVMFNEPGRRRPAKVAPAVGRGETSRRGPAGTGSLEDERRVSRI